MDEVVGDEPQPSVADLGLDDSCFARRLSLATQGPELTTDLGGEVLDPGEVGLHGFQLAQRAFLALAVFEDPGGLLDETAPLLRSRPKHGVELALTDDDVHLATDAAVGQQLLDVEQSTGRAVDCVVGPAVAEHGPADRHLGVVDRQGAVGVVDGQGHLGAPERRSARRAGKDDVLHLAAAQALGALLPHHPGQSVNDVGLARAVGADDAGDARFEAQRRRRRERLEPLEGHALDVHVKVASCCGDGDRSCSGYRRKGPGTDR